MKLTCVSFWKVIMLIGLLFCNSCMDRSAPGKGQSRKDLAADSLTASSDALKLQEKSLRTIPDIQQAYATVSTKLKSGALDSVSFKYSCNNEKSGTVSYFSEKGQLRLVVHRYNEYSHFSGVDQYFVKDSTLFFVYRNSILWSFSGPQGSTKDSITEQRTYLINQRPVRCLQKTFVVRSHAAHNPRSETVPGKEVDCTSVKSVIKAYRLLIKYHNNTTTGCLE